MADERAPTDFEDAKQRLIVPEWASATGTCKITLVFRTDQYEDSGSKW